MSERVRVLRLVEYVGPRDLVEGQVSKSIHGTRVIGTRDHYCRITAVTIGEFPEVLSPSTVKFLYPGEPDASSGQTEQQASTKKEFLPNWNGEP